ncbi:MAG: hypothetical protein ACI37T_08695 [Candidatus Gastranaerophilaceae bacterium]
MEKLLEALGLNSVLTVGISVSASNIIEMICIDKNQRVITQYACKELKYNNAIREIINYDDFSMAVQELFQELNINPKGCNVVLNLPNVHFGITSLPLVLPVDQISTAIASDVEELYLFKRHEPVVSWNTITENEEEEKRYIIFGAIQENTLQNIKDIFDEIGARLVAVETANSSMLKGLIYSQTIEDEFDNEESLDILLISPNSYSIFSMQGSKIIDYYEEPLAIKSFTSDEVYIAIASAAGTALENYPANNLLVISETNEVSAEVLCHKISFEGDIKFLDRNIYTDKPIMEVSSDIISKYIPVISLEAVGTGAYYYDTFPVKFNFLQDGVTEDLDKIKFSALGNEYEIEKKSLLNISGLAGIIVLCFFLLISLAISIYDKKKQAEITTISNDYNTIKMRLDETKRTGNVSSVYTVQSKISEENTKEIALFYGLGSEIPEDVYLMNFFSSSQGEVRIEGSASSSESIYSYVKGLKTKYPDIKISKLQIEMDEENQKQTVYSFLIESEESSRRAAEEALKEQQDQQQQQDQKVEENKFKGLFPIAPSASSMPSVPSIPRDSATQNTPSAAVPQANAPGGLPAPAAP